MSHRFLVVCLALLLVLGASSAAFAGGKPHVKKAVKKFKEHKHHHNHHHGKPR